MIKVKKWLYQLLKNEYMINDVLTFIILVVIYIGINKEIDFEDFVYAFNCFYCSYIVF